MKNKKYKSLSFLGIFAIIALHVVLLCTGVFHLPFAPVLTLDAFLSVLFVAGTLLISPGLDKAPDSFVNRFTLLTTFQLLSMMVGVLILAMTRVPYFKILGYHLFAVFVCLLTVQVFLLVRSIKQQ
jgi:hypothetical protein